MLYVNDISLYHFTPKWNNYFNGTNYPPVTPQYCAICTYKDKTGLYFTFMFLSLLMFLNHAAELLTNNKLSELACLALYLMYEKKQGKDSFWYPYIKELDRHRGRGQLAVESPLLWTESELDYLSGSPLKVSGFTLLYLNSQYNIIPFLC